MLRLFFCRERRQWTVSSWPWLARRCKRSFFSCGREYQESHGLEAPSRGGPGLWKPCRGTSHSEQIWARKSWLAHIGGPAVSGNRAPLRPLLDCWPDLCCSAVPPLIKARANTAALLQRGTEETMGAWLDLYNYSARPKFLSLRFMVTLGLATLPYPRLF